MPVACTQSLLSQVSSLYTQFSAREVSNIIWSLGTLHFTFPSTAGEGQNYDPSSGVVEASEHAASRLLQKGLSDKVISSAKEFSRFDLESVVDGLANIHVDP